MGDPIACICGAGHLEAATPVPVDPRLPYPPAPVVVADDVHRCLACGHVSILTDREPDAWVGEVEPMIERVDAFAAWWAPHLRERVPTAVQFNAGLGRPASALARDGWGVVVTDPDQDRVDFLRSDAGLDAECGSPASFQHLGQFDLVLVVGALEYERDPGSMLVDVVRHVAPGGFVYLEVPDGDRPVDSASMPDGLRPGQRHAFTQTSVSVLVSQAGVSSLSVERVTDSSGPARFAVCCAVAEPARPDDERRPLRQIAVENPTGPAAAWADIEDPTLDPDGTNAAAEPRR